MATSVEQLSYIKFRVGERKFYVSPDTLKESDYWRGLLDNSTPAELQNHFIDRDPEAFVAILAFMRNEHFVVPYKYKSELEFYGISFKWRNLCYEVNDLRKLPFVLSAKHTCFILDHMNGCFTSSFGYKLQLHHLLYGRSPPTYPDFVFTAYGFTIYNNDILECKNSGIQLDYYPNNAGLDSQCAFYGYVLDTFDELNICMDPRSDT